MKKGFAMLLVAFTLSMTMTMGFASFYSPTVQAQAQLQEVSVISEAPKASVALEEVSEVPKLCKDEQGQAKVCSDEDFLKALAASFGGYSGATSLGVAFLIVNCLMAFLYSPLGANILPKKFETDGYKLLLALFLYLASGVIGLMLPPTSLPLTAALTHSTSLAAFGVLFNQILKKYAKSKAAKLAV